ncbi:hypothetical protein TNIN_484971 [Trichonephila inaurata madagascariensis]|uniref:Uncharacterized protein n=1 Tax=Trichonephila inaurata madagascariensis TaxID=2747483 RepID=A0A8X6X9G5_9ARAC|nr:hypothetical protein TNIN_484971 [Trichonephila inaurata madagascariensis]
MTIPSQRWALSSHSTLVNHCLMTRASSMHCRESYKKGDHTEIELHSPHLLMHCDGMRLRSGGAASEIDSFERDCNGSGKEASTVDETSRFFLTAVTWCRRALLRKNQKKKT